MKYHKVKQEQPEPPPPTASAAWQQPTQAEQTDQPTNQPRNDRQRANKGLRTASQGRESQTDGQPTKRANKSLGSDGRGKADSNNPSKADNRPQEPERAKNGRTDNRPTTDQGQPERARESQQEPQRTTHRPTRTDTRQTP